MTVAPKALEEGRRKDLCSQSGRQWTLRKERALGMGQKFPYFKAGLRNSCPQRRL